MRDILGIIGVTERKLRYWLRQYVPHSGERMWGQPRLTFADLFWLAYMARARQAGVSAQRARHGIPRAQRLLETWPVPLSQTVLCEVGPHLVLTAGRYAIEAPESMVIVDGPELARAVLTRHKRRVRAWTRRNRRPSTRGPAPE